MAFSGGFRAPAPKKKSALGRAFDSTTNVPLAGAVPAPKTKLATTLGDALTGAIKSSTAEERGAVHAKAPDGSTLFTNTQAGNARKGAKFTTVTLGGKKRHIYYGADGTRQVITPK